MCMKASEVHLDRGNIGDLALYERRSTGHIYLYSYERLEKQRIHEKVSNNNFYQLADFF